MSRKIKELIMRTINHRWFAMGTAVVALFGLGLLAANDVKADPFTVQAPAPNGMIQKRVPIDVFCADSAIIHEVLEEEYGETPIAMSVNERKENGVGPEGAYLLWFTNHERTTFSIVSDGGMGVSCILLSGACAPGDCFVPSVSLWK